MSVTGREDWVEANQAHLVAELQAVKARLRAQLAETRPAAMPAQEQPAAASSEQPPGATSTAAAGDVQGAPASALDYVTHTFGLSSFERAVLLLCAGVELDSEIPRLCAALHGDAQRSAPTFSLALALLADAHWSALTPDAPLRRWRLIELGNGAPVTSAPLHIDERVLHYLVGISSMDPAISSCLIPLDTRTLPPLTQPQQGLVDQLASALATAPAPPHASTTLQLCSRDPLERRQLASHLAHRLGCRAAVMPAELLPSGALDFEQFARLWARESALDAIGLVVLECDGLASGGAGSDDARTQSRMLARMLEALPGHVLLSDCDRRKLTGRASVAFDLPRPTSGERAALWQDVLAGSGITDADIAALAAQFNLSSSAIRAAALEARSSVPGASTLEARASDPGTGVSEAGPGASTTAAVAARVASAAWQACRRHARGRLDGLAERVITSAGWDDLVLPPAQMATLRSMAAQLRHRITVYETWGFGAKSARGQGISALFAGPSGTGKTLAAEVLSQALELDLYRIDLSSVVSKYIGETERNLRQVFDAAEESSAILLFDEADALFGKRSEVKDSHDRYANIEVSYLLQRMEAYSGLAVLTTNLKAALDTAFLRRLRFVVQFAFPDAVQRAEIWRRSFPPGTPTVGLDPAKLGRLNVAGGNIRNIALNAAFLAAEAGQPVGMAQVLAAARSEYLKLERPLTDAEIGGWT